MTIYIISVPCCLEDLPTEIAHQVNEIYEVLVPSSSNQVSIRFSSYMTGHGNSLMSRAELQAYVDSMNTEFWIMQFQKKLEFRDGTYEWVTA